MALRNGLKAYEPSIKSADLEHTNPVIAPFTLFSRAEARKYPGELFIAAHQILTDVFVIFVSQPYAETRSPVMVA